MGDLGASQGRSFSGPSDNQLGTIQVDITGEYGHEEAPP